MRLISFNWGNCSHKSINYQALANWRRLIGLIQLIGASNKWIESCCCCCCCCCLIAAVIKSEIGATFNWSHSNLHKSWCDVICNSITNGIRLIMELLICKFAYLMVIRQNQVDIWFNYHRMSMKLINEIGCKCSWVIST